MLLSRHPTWLSLTGMVLLIHLLAGCTPNFVAALDSASTATPLVTSTTRPTQTSTPSPPPISPTTATATSSPNPTVAASPTVPSTTTPAPTPTFIAAAERQQLFEQVWNTVNDHYLYPDFRGVDWDRIRLEFEPQIAQATTNEEFYALLTEMVGRLNDQHSRFLAPAAADEEDVLSTGHEANVGIGVIMISTANGALIQQVFPGSPAALAGLQPRDRIIAVDGVPTNVGYPIRGPKGTPVNIKVLRPGEAPREIELIRQPVEGRITPTAHRLEGDIGYLAITTLWVNDMGDQVSGALTDLVVEKPLRGLIIDVRSNPGGWRDVLTSILSHFVQGDVGYFFDQRQDTPLTVNESSGPDLRGLPLVILVDRGTSSYAELFAAILQTEVNATVIGVPLIGNTETIYAYELTGGARLWVAQEGFRLRNGTDLEGHGVRPDVLVNLDWTRYSQETDPHILEALRQFEQQAKEDFHAATND